MAPDKLSSQRSHVNRAIIRRIEPCQGLPEIYLESMANRVEGMKMWECLLWSCHGFLHPVCTGILPAGPFLLPERGEDYGISHGDLPWHPLTPLGMWPHPQSGGSKREKWERGWDSTFCSSFQWERARQRSQTQVPFGAWGGNLGT